MSSIVSFSQSTSSYIDTIVGRYQEFVPVQSLFTTSQQNSNRSSGCSVSCSGAKSYHLRTGYSGYDDTSDPIPFLNPDLNWRIVQDNCPETFEPRLPTVIGIPDYWGEMGVLIDGLPADVGRLSVAGPDEGETSLCLGQGGYGMYKLQTKFCISDDAEDVSIKLKCLSDDNATIFLNGVELGTQGPISYGWTTGNLLEIDFSEIGLIGGGLFEIGENILEVVVRDYVAKTALMLYADIEVSEGCVGCCTKGGAINGYKYNDLNANGSLEIGEPKISGVEFELYDITDPGIAPIYVNSVFSNYDGYFEFLDVDPFKTYKVIEVMPGWINTIPGTGEYTDIYVDENSVVNNLLFLNTEVGILGPCEDCGNAFAPIPGERYWISAWVNVDHPTDQKTYELGIDGPFLRIVFLGTDVIIPEMLPSGEIIDGWQRIVGSFYIPEGATNILVSMNADGDYDTYFDDIRLHPFNGSMKSYVYDGETFWLVSELDDNNYATFYEYDQEGGLIRIKKETARGIVTIQETRSNTVKK